LYSINNFILGSGKLGLALGYQQNVRREFSHPQAPGIPGLFLRLNSWTYDLKYSPEFKGWELTLGIDGMEQTNINAGTDFIIPDYNQFDIGTYVNVKKSRDKFDISAGFRFDSRSMLDRELFVAVNPSTGFNEKSDPGTLGALQIFTGQNNNFTGISGSLGATWNATDKFLIKANIARGFRTPNIFEISANGVHPGTAIYQIGNSVFKPEFSLQEDLGIFYSSKYMNWSVELFNNNITNYIFNQKLLNHFGKDSVIVKGNQTFKFMQSGADLNGLEGSIDIHPHPLDWLHFENSVSVIYAKNLGGNGVLITDSSRYLPSIPPFHWHSELRAEMKSKLRYISSWNANLEMDYYATQKRVYSAYNTETPTNGYTLFNVGFGVEVANKSGKSIFSFSILCNNIADVAYQSHLSRLKYFEQYPVNQTGRTGIFNMGRNIGFRLTVPFVLRS
jgi:iron complex outermembrane receptor protein